MVQFMAAACQRHRELQKQKKATMWVRVLGGLLVTIVCSSASLNPRARSSPLLELLVVSFALVGTILLFSGLWRFVAGPRPMRAAELTAAWRKQNK